MGKCLSKDAPQRPADFTDVITPSDNNGDPGSPAGTSQVSKKHAKVPMPLPPVSPTRAEPPDNRKVLIALYDYEVRSDGDLAFHKGDRLLLIDDTDNDWWRAQHVVTKLDGYIPSNYVAQDDTLNPFEWFMKIDRNEANRLLTTPSHPIGTFLVRESTTQPGSFALSIKWTNETDKQPKHYRVRQKDDGNYFITTRMTFTTLEELVEFYQLSADGLVCRLTISCPKVKPEVAGLGYAQKDQYEIDRNKFLKLERLGAGNFGEVWRGMYNRTTPVAIKTLKAGTMSAEAFLQEAKIMKECKHDNLVQLFAVCTKSEPIYIVTELMKNGALKDYLRSTEGQALQQNILIDMGAQVAKGMDFLARKPLIHRDLAARNVLVGESNVVKVADFGMARLIEDSEYQAQAGARFPVKWTAPEAISYQKFSVKSDVWSFGILLVEIITKGAVPYPGMTNAEVMGQIERGFKHPKPFGCPPPLYDLMKKCWNQEAEQRPTFEYLYSTLEDFEISTTGQYE